VIVDYHMHLRNGSEEVAHDTWSVDPFVAAARAAGVDEIGFTEHVYYFTQTRSLWTVPYQTERCLYDLDAYVDAVVQARERGQPVKLGLEVDYVPGREDETRKLLAPYPWDYLLGSVHFVDGFGVDGEPKLLDEVGVEEAWSRYFETLAAAARSGLFDSLSHPDLVKIFGERAAAFDYAEVADAIAQTGIAVEVSTAGLRKPVEEIYPSSAFLEMIVDAGNPIALSSDAHTTDQLGYRYDDALRLMADHSVTELAVFDRLERRLEAIG